MVLHPNFGEMSIFGLKKYTHTHFCLFQGMYIYTSANVPTVPIATMKLGYIVKTKGTECYSMTSGGEVNHIKYRVKALMCLQQFNFV